jgi:CheY-like chemotaxis protein
MKGSPTVLVVDDVQSNRDVISATLEGMDISILNAESGYETVDIANQVELALILLDVMMPGMDGIETARELRKKGITAPIMFITAHELSDERLLGEVAVGAVDHLQKPFAAIVLRVKVNVWVELFRMRRELDKSRELLSNYSPEALSELIASHGRMREALQRMSIGRP